MNTLSCSRRPISRLPLLGMCLALFPSLTKAEILGGTAIVRHAPSVNSAIVEGSLQILLPENLQMQGEATVTGELRVPGNPTLIRQGNVSVGSIATGRGRASPPNYQVKMDERVHVGTFRTRVDAVAMPVVPVLLAPTGTRSLDVNGSGQRVGNWRTIRDLTLNNHAGSFVAPEGKYGTFVVMPRVMRICEKGRTGN